MSLYSTGIFYIKFIHLCNFLYRMHLYILLGIFLSLKYTNCEVIPFHIVCMLLLIFCSSLYAAWISWILLSHVGHMELVFFCKHFVCNFWYTIFLGFSIMSNLIVKHVLLLLLLFCVSLHIVDISCCRTLVFKYRIACFWVALYYRAWQHDGASPFALFQNHWKFWQRYVCVATKQDLDHRTQNNTTISTRTWN